MENLSVNSFQVGYVKLAKTKTGMKLATSHLMESNLRVRKILASSKSRPWNSNFTSAYQHGLDPADSTAPIQAMLWHVDPC